jgi:hypothetical protein
MIVPLNSQLKKRKGSAPCSFHGTEEWMEEVCLETRWHVEKIEVLQNSRNILHGNNSFQFSYHISHITPSSMKNTASRFIQFQ